MNVSFLHAKVFTYRATTCRVHASQTLFARAEALEPRAAIMHVGRRVSEEVEGGFEATVGFAMLVAFMAYLAHLAHQNRAILKSGVWRKMVEIRWRGIVNSWNELKQRSMDRADASQLPQEESPRLAPVHERKKFVPRFSIPAKCKAPKVRVMWCGMSTCGAHVYTWRLVRLQGSPPPRERR